MPNSAANNNNSMEAFDLQSSLSYKEEKYLEPNETETETFLTEEGIRAILEKAMKKQRVDLKLFRQIDDWFMYLFIYTTMYLLMYLLTKWMYAMVRSLGIVSCSKWQYASIQ